MENKDFKSDYPDGKCEYCGMVFKRPNKWRTEAESYHQYGCQLDGIKNAIKNKEEFEIYEIIDQLERISKVSSFAAKPPRNKYWNRMVECDAIIKKLDPEYKKPNPYKNKRDAVYTRDA